MRRKWILTGMALALALALAGCGSNAATDEQLQDNRQASYISMDAAQSAALDAASIAAEDANFSSTELDDVAGITCYKVEFSAGGYEYAYSINAESGEVLEANCREQAAAASGSANAASQQSGTKPPDSGAGSAPVSGMVDEGKALEIALNHAGVKVEDATITEAKLHYEDGRQIYEFEWYTNGAKYDYEIAVATGEIIDSGYEAKAVIGTEYEFSIDAATDTVTEWDTGAAHN